MVRGTLDRVLVAMANAALWLFFRRVEVVGDTRVADGRPVLVIANHFYGFIDPVLLVRVLGGLPRFLAKSTLWRPVLLRPLLGLAKVLPVRRPEDGSDVAANESMFAATHRALARREWVGIFPEGTTHDDASVRRLRTGAARIALGAWAEGVEDLVVLPIGMLFDDKIALRGRVLARVGAPLEMRTVVEELEAAGHRATDHDRASVQLLTDAFASMLREVAPDFRDEHEARVLRRAAEVALRAGEEGPVRRGGVADSLSAQDQLARRIAAAGDEHVEAVTDALGRYHLALDIVGIGDLQVESRVEVEGLFRRTVLATVRLALLAPFAVVGLAWNVLPYLLVQWAGRLVPRPIARGTLRLSVALVVFPATWVTIALTDGRSGFLWGLAVFLAAPVLGAVGVGWLEAVVRGYRDWRGWLGLTERRALLGRIEHARQAVLDAVAEAVAAEPG